MAPDTHNAATKKVATAVAFGDENSPQLTKIAVSQKIITNNNGLNTVVELCSITSERINTTLLSRLVASDFIRRWSSSCGVRARSWL